MNILNGTQAFEAMSAGQKIECRHVASNLDFDDIRNFSATVFVDQDYEFRIAVIYMMIGVMQVPEAVKDTPAKGVQCFSPSLLTAELSKAFKWRNSDSDLVLLKRGLVHLYEENAITHAKALIAVSHGSTEKLKAKTDDLDWLDPVNDQNPTSNDVEEKTFTSQSNIEITEQGPIAVVEDSLTDFSTQKEPVEHDQIFIQKSAEIKDDYIRMLSTCETEDALNGVHSMIMVNDLVTSSDKYSLSVHWEEAVEARKKALDDEYKNHLNQLLDGVLNAKTPAEANAHTRYTKPWTEAQRKPLLDAIHKRLNELASYTTETKEPPSLMVQIQNAQNEHELNELLPDIRSRHPDIQPKLMGCVKQRRFELENQSGEVAS